MARACGTFDVKLSRLEHSDSTAGSPLARMSIDKTFEGDLAGGSKGEMLAAGTGVKDSAGYVAIERVSGTLNGRPGSFVFQHSSTMSRGVPRQSIMVVPDSGTGDLVGLSGMMTITMSDGKHYYDFEYALAAES